MKTVLLLLLAVSSLVMGGEAYKPFGVGIGTNVYEVPGGYENTKLAEMGYTDRSASSNLDHVPVKTLAEYQAWFPVYISEQAEREIIERRPELAHGTLADWETKRRASGTPKVFWSYHKRLPDETRSVTIIFNGDTGLVVMIEASANAKSPERLADLKNAVAAVGRGAAGTTTDGLIVVARNRPRDPRPESKRIPADELPPFVEGFFVRNDGEEDRLVIANSNPPNAANPFGVKQAFGLVKCEVRGSAADAHVNVHLEDLAPPNYDETLRTMIRSRADFEISERQKELIQKQKKAKPAADGF